MPRRSPSHAPWCRRHIRALQSDPMGALVSLADDPAVDDGHRRGRILWALATCMATKGYQATTISDIARAAPVSKTVVDAPLPHKEHCLLELSSRANDKVLATVREAQEDAHRAGLPWRERPRGGPPAPLGGLGGRAGARPGG